MSEPWQAESAPYVRVVRTPDGNATVEGQPEASFGHRIELGPGREPGGNWAAWRWDGTELHIVNDTFRGFPLYYAAGTASISVSPIIDALLQHDPQLGPGAGRELDLDALAVFLTVGYYIGDDTPFRRIRALPPAATVRWGPDGLRIVSRPRRFESREVPRQQAVAMAAELVRSAVRGSIPDDDAYLFPLSGGHDSRHLLLELLDAGHPPTACVTAHHHPHIWGGDVPYAAAVAAALGLRHHIVTPGPLIAAEWRKNRLTSYCADEHAWYTAVAEALDGRTSHTYDGLNGFALREPPWRSERSKRLHAQGRFDDFAASLGRRHRGAPRYAPLIARARRRDLDDGHAAARIRAGLAAYEDQPHPFRAWRLANRTVRELGLQVTGMLPGVPAAFTPFMHPDLIELTESLPPGSIDDAFHDEILALRFPIEHALPYRPKTQPRPGRAYQRSVARDMLRLLRDHSDGSLVDRGALMRRALVSAATGGDWLTWGRRASLLVYLVQLECILRGDGPGPLQR